MKYIRTVDGIYEIVDFDNEGIIPSPIIKMDGRLTHILNYKDCPQASTIEELCDKFVVVLKDKHKRITDNIYDREEYYEIYTGYDFAKNYYEEKYHDFYGAIWTDKGLIYVAKMNKDGELELI